jgi:hypothetical protein
VGAIGSLSWDTGNVIGEVVGRKVQFEREAVAELGAKRCGDGCE